jgi:hypothetical protein
MSIKNGTNYNQMFDNKSFSSIGATDQIKTIIPAANISVIKTRDGRTKVWRAETTGQSETNRRQAADYHLVTDCQAGDDHQDIK